VARSPLLPLLRFHFAVGARLAMRLLVPVVAAAFGAGMLLGTDFVTSLSHVLFGSRASGGNVLAAALVGTPRQVLLDEPLEAMDRGAREDLLAWTGRLVESGAAVVVVSHEIEPFAPRATRALAVRGGRCLDAGALPAEPGERLALLDRLARGA
jgi:ABC-type uncharacterized transport system YnjBCD ATPase subunit